MPAITTPDGRTVYVPGVYSDIKVVSNLPGPLPAFQIPIVLGQCDEGFPYHGNDIKEDVEDRRSPFTALGTSSATKKAYGPDSEISTAMAWAKRHGLPFAFLLCASKLTRGQVIAQSGGPITEGTIFARKHGAVGGHIKLAVVGGNTVTVTPVKRYSFLTEDGAIGDTRIRVKDSRWIRDGQTITIGDNNSNNADYVVDTVGSELDSDGQVVYWVELTTALLVAITTAQYGMVLEYDDDNAEEPDAFATVQEMVDWFNDESEFLNFQTAATFSSPATLVAVAASTPLKEIAVWGGATAGTSPAPTSSDYDDIITALDATEWDQFALDWAVLPQAFLVVDSSSTVHQAFRDWAIAKRTEGFPVSVTVGCAWGDIDLGAVGDTNPTVRAVALNSQDVMLAACGLDKLGAYLSLAPAIYGRRIGGGIGHNLTNDELLYNEVEVMWDERGSQELTTLHKRGVATVRLSTSKGVRFKVSQGLLTLQANLSAWNEGSDDTPLAMQRDLADFVDRVLKEDLDGSQIGADEVNPSTIAAVITRRAEKSLKRRGYITSFSIDSIELNDGATGYDVEWTVALPTTGDFITLVTNILIGEE